MPQGPWTWVIRSGNEIIAGLVAGALAYWVVLHLSWLASLTSPCASTVETRPWASYVVSVRVCRQVPSASFA